MLSNGFGSNSFLKDKGMSYVLSNGLSFRSIPFNSLISLGRGILYRTLPQRKKDMDNFITNFFSFYNRSNKISNDSLLRKQKWTPQKASIFLF